MKMFPILGAMVLVILAGQFGGARAQTLTTLHSFTQHPDGAVPGGRLVLGSDGNVYGTTELGGTNICSDGPCFSYGAVFNISTGGAENVLFRFSGGNGSTPVAGLLQAGDSNFYGTAQYGGFYGSGTVFRITSAGTLTTLHVCGSHARDGANPVGGLVQGPDGTFFGTTENGGTFNFGTVFAMDGGGTLTTVHHFSGVGDDGQTPLSGLTTLVASDQTNLFGTTYSGGSNGLGTVFQIVYRPLPFSSIYTTLYSFTGDADGANPRGELVQGNDGNLYGTTLNGGIGCGTVFQINTNGTFNTLWQFCSYSNNLDGAGPYAGLVKGSDGNFYGTTRNGGLYGSGVAFQITTNGVLTPLYQFCSSGGCADGANPIAGLVQGSDGNFYGTTEGGGTSANCGGGCGTVFVLNPTISTWTWDGGGADDLWTTTGNWRPSGFPHNGDTALFVGNTRLTPNNNITDLLLTALEFLPGSNAFILAGNALSIGAGGIANSSSSPQTISLPLMLTADQQHTAMSPLIFWDMIDGSVNLTLSGPSSVTFWADVGSMTPLNSLTGNGGMVALSHTIATSGNMDFSGATALTLAGDATVNSSVGSINLGSAQPLQGNGHSLMVTASGPTALNGAQGLANLTVAGGGLLGISGATSASGYVNFLGSSTVSLSGDTLVSGGTLAFAPVQGNGYNLTATASGPTALNGAQGLANLTVAGGGLLGISGATSASGYVNFLGSSTVSLSGDTLVSGGTLAFAPVQGNGYNLTATASGPTALNGAQGLANLTVAGGGLLGISGATSASGYVNFLGSSTVSLSGDTLVSGGTLAFAPVQGNGYNLTATASGPTALNGAQGLANLTVAGGGLLGISGTTSASGYVNFLGSSTVSLSGDTLVSGGTLAFAPVQGNGYGLTVTGTATTLSGGQGLGTLYVASSTTTISGGTLATTGYLNLSPSGTVGLGSDMLLSSATASVALPQVQGNGYNLTVITPATATFNGLVTGVNSLNVTASVMNISPTAALRVPGNIAAGVLNNSGIIAPSTGMLTFSDTTTMTNIGTVQAPCGTSLVFYGPVVNYGLIDALCGNVFFESDFINHGTIITSNCPPVITAIQVVGLDVEISFTTCSNVPYTVEYDTNLVSGTWTTLTNLTAVGSITSVVDPGAAVLTQRFYRAGLVD